MTEFLENKINWQSDEEILYRLQLQIQARQIDQQRRKDEVAAQYKKYEDQIKNLFVTLNTQSKRIWILINSKSYSEHYDTLRYQPDYKKIENGIVFQKITNYLLTPKMDIKSMLSLCSNNEKHLQLSQFVYLLSLFCYLYSNEMASLFVDFFLQINTEKVEAFNQCFLLNPNIQIYFKTSLKPIFAQLRKNQRKETLFKSLLDSLAKFSPLIPKFFIRVLRKSKSRGLIFYKLLKTFLLYFDAFAIAGSEFILYYKTQIKGLSKMSRKYYVSEKFDDFILNVLLSKENIRKNCSFVPFESSLKKIFPYLYRPFILIDKMSLSNLNINSDFLFVYVKQSQEEIDIEQKKNNYLLQNQDIFDEMVQINKITNSSNFESNSLFISKSNSSFNDVPNSKSTPNINRKSDSYFISNMSYSSNDNLSSNNLTSVKIVCRNDDIESQENRKTAKKLFLKIAQRFLLKANLVKITNNSKIDHNYKDTSEIGKKTLALFKRIAELSSVFKNPDLEIEIDKLEIILSHYPMSVNDLASLFEENDLSIVMRESEISHNITQPNFLSKSETDDLELNENDGLSDAILSSLSSNPLFAVSLYEKQFMMLKKILVLLDDVNKASYESAIFRTILENTKLSENDQPTSVFIQNPRLFNGFYYDELTRLQKDPKIAKFFDQTIAIKSSPRLSPSSPSLSSSSTPFEAAYKSLFMIAIYEAGLSNRKEYPEAIKRLDKQMSKVLGSDDGKEVFLESLRKEQNAKVFFENPEKFAPLIDQLKNFFNSKSYTSKFTITERSDSNSSLNSCDGLGSKSSLKSTDDDNIISSDDSLSFHNITNSSGYGSSNGVFDEIKLKSSSKKGSNSHHFILGLMFSNFDCTLKILNMLLGGKKADGMDVFLPIVCSAIIFAEPSNLNSAFFFLNNFVFPFSDPNSLVFSDQDKYILTTLHSALSFLLKNSKQ